jgi:hypothetical protein
MARRCKHWLSSYSEYIAETESPKKFWAWSGIFVLASSLQRRTWLNFGIENLYPNLYVMVVAPPGRCRKGAPLGLAKRILTEAQIPVFVDSPTKRALTKYLHELGKTSFFQIDGSPKPQSPVALISKELSSFMAVNPKEMIEVLTDLFDSHDVWEYKTSEKGTDKLYGVCVSCFFATTPSWMATNLPEEAIGGGFTSRFVLVSGTNKDQFIPIPPVPPEALYRDLVRDIVHISQICGEFIWDPAAKKIYEDWYLTIEGKVKATHDERLHGFLERIHIMALKVSMALHIAYSDRLVITEEDISTAITLLEQALKDAPAALSSHGRSDLGVDTDKIAMQVRTLGTVQYKELVRMNYRNVRPDQLQQVLQTLDAMGSIKMKWKGANDAEIKWKGLIK